MPAKKDQYDTLIHNINRVRDFPPFVLVNTKSVFKYLLRNAQAYCDQGIDEMTDEYTLQYVKSIQDAKNFIFPGTRSFFEDVD